MGEVAARVALIIALWLAPTTVLAENCKVEDWRFENRSSFISIEGTTTCASGQIFVRAYEGDKYLGNATAYIQGYTFTALITGARAKPLNQIRDRVNANQRA
jgi:hypothetical protein